MTLTPTAMLPIVASVFTSLLSLWYSAHAVWTLSIVVVASLARDGGLQEVPPWWLIWGAVSFALFCAVCFETSMMIASAALPTTTTPPTTTGASVSGGERRLRWLLTLAVSSFAGAGSDGFGVSTDGGGVGGVASVSVPAGGGVAATGAAEAVLAKRAMAFSPAS